MWCLRGGDWGHRGHMRPDCHSVGIQHISQLGKTVPVICESLGLALQGRQGRVEEDAWMNTEIEGLQKEEPKMQDCNNKGKVSPVFVFYRALKTKPQAARSFKWQNLFPHCSGGYKPSYIISCVTAMLCSFWWLPCFFWPLVFISGPWLPRV